MSYIGPELLGFFGLPGGNERFNLNYTTMENPKLKEITDRIRKKPEDSWTWEDKWYLWLEKQSNDPNTYDVGEEKKYMEPLTGTEKDGFGDPYPDWFYEEGSKIGQKCKSLDGTIQTLIGMSETFEDYYYILLSEEGKTTYLSCVGGIEFI